MSQWVPKITQKVRKSWQISAKRQNFPRTFCPNFCRNSGHFAPHFLRSCQAIFEGLGFSQLANSDERKLRQPRLFHWSIFSAVLFFMCKLLNRVLGNPANWSAFPDRHAPVIWQGRASRGGHIGQIQETWGSFLHAALLDHVCLVHSRVDCWREKTRPRS